MHSLRTLIASAGTTITASTSIATPLC